MTRIPPVRRLLMDAKALIHKPEKWIKIDVAQSDKGNSVKIFGPDACRFCAFGAILRASYNTDCSRKSEVENKGNLLLDKMSGGNFIVYSDASTTTHPMIMRLFNKAIRRAKEQGI